MIWLGAAVVTLFSGCCMAHVHAHIKTSAWPAAADQNGAPILAGETLW